MSPKALDREWRAGSMPWAEVSSVPDGERVVTNFVTDGGQNKLVVMSARRARYLSRALRIAARKAELGEPVVFLID